MSAVPDVLAPNLTVLFCGINPGFVSAAAAAHFANPRNDFWRLLHDAGFTPRLVDPQEQFEVPGFGIGLTNAALRTTKGSGDLRSGDFAGSAERLYGIARDYGPRAIAFVGKEAYRGAFRERPELGPQLRTLVDTGLFVLPHREPIDVETRGFLDDEGRRGLEGAEVAEGSVVHGVRIWISPSRKIDFRARHMQKAERIPVGDRRRFVGGYDIVRNGGDVPCGGRRGSKSTKRKKRSH